MSELSSHENTYRKLSMHFWKKPLWRGCMLYYSNHMTFEKKQNHGDSKKILVIRCWVEGRKGWIGIAQRSVRAVKICWNCNGCMSSHFCSTHKTPRVNMSTPVVIMRQHRFINFSKVPLQWQMMMKRGYARGGQGRAYIGNLWTILSILLWI